MARLLSILTRPGLLLVGLLLAAPALAQEPASPPEAAPSPPPALPPEMTLVDVPPSPGSVPPGSVPPGSAAPAPPGAAAPTSADALRTLVVDAAVYAVDPVVGRHTTAQMRTTAAELGYAVMSGPETVAAAQRLRMPYPPTPADLWRVTYVARAHRGAFARVWAHSGQYVIEITVASLDGAGPFFARGTSGAADLHQVVDRLLRQALPAPSTYVHGGAQGAPAGQPQAPTRAEVPAGEVVPGEEARPRRAERRRRRRVRRRRVHLAVQTEGAIGTSQDSFYNHLVGARVDYRISREILFGAYLGYANLRGKDGRVSNVLGYLQVEDRVRIIASSDVTVPLRLGIGYLPFNGPVVRLSAGINIPLSRELQLGFDILTPTFWVLPDRTAVSLNLAAELIWRP